MIQTTVKSRHGVVCRAFCALLLSVFTFSVILPVDIAQAQILPVLPLPGSMITATPGYIPALIKGMTIHPENPLQFDFIVDNGHSKLHGKELEAEALSLIKYFLASLTVPEDELWVNLSPYEKDRVISERFGMTEMGMNLLAQDYILKQLTASMMYPEDETGKKFWKRVYARAQKEFGTTDIPMDNFHKVWIVPQDALVMEDGNSAYVIESRLRVMLEEDYFAQRNSHGDGRARPLGAPETSADQMNGGPGASRPTALQTQVMKEILLPEIEKEVNEGKNFAQLRQIYQSLILATWFKKALKESLLGQVYVDKNKIKGVDTDDPALKEKIYEQYVKAFEQGVYNYIKEEVDPATNQIVPRNYFSGGLGMQVSKVAGSVRRGSMTRGQEQMASRRLRRQGDDEFAMTTNLVENLGAKEREALQTRASARRGSSDGRGFGDHAMLVEAARFIGRNAVRSGIGVFNVMTMVVPARKRTLALYDMYRKQLRDLDVTGLPIADLGVHLPESDAFMRMNGAVLFRQKGIAVWAEETSGGLYQTNIPFSLIRNVPLEEDYEDQRRSGSRKAYFWRTHKILERMVQDFGDIRIDYSTDVERHGMGGLSDNEQREVIVMGVRYKKGSLNTPENLEQLRVRIQEWASADSDLSDLVMPSREQIQKKVARREFRSNALIWAAAGAMAVGIATVGLTLSIGFGNALRDARLGSQTPVEERIDADESAGVEDVNVPAGEQKETSGDSAMLANAVVEHPSHVIAQGYWNDALSRIDYRQLLKRHVSFGDVTFPEQLIADAVVLGFQHDILAGDISGIEDMIVSAPGGQDKFTPYLIKAHVLLSSGRRVQKQLIESITRMIEEQEAKQTGRIKDFAMLSEETREAAANAILEESKDTVVTVAAVDDFLSKARALPKQEIVIGKTNTVMPLYQFLEELGFTHALPSLVYKSYFDGRFQDPAAREGILFAEEAGPSGSRGMAMELSGTDIKLLLALMLERDVFRAQAQALFVALQGSLLSDADKETMADQIFHRVTDPIIKTEWVDGFLIRAQLMPDQEIPIASNRAKALIAFIQEQKWDHGLSSLDFGSYYQDKFMRPESRKPGLLLFVEHDERKTKQACLAISKADLKLLFAFMVTEYVYRAQAQAWFLELQRNIPADAAMLTQVMKTAAWGVPRLILGVANVISSVALSRVIDVVRYERMEADLKNADISQLPIVMLGVHLFTVGPLQEAIYHQKGIALWKSPEAEPGERIYFSIISRMPKAREVDDQRSFWWVFDMTQKMVEDFGDITIDYVSDGDERKKAGMVGGIVVKVMGVRYKKRSMNTDENLAKLRTRVQEWVTKNQTKFMMEAIDLAMLAEIEAVVDLAREHVDALHGIVPVETRKDHLREATRLVIGMHDRLETVSAAIQAEPFVMSDIGSTPEGIAQTIDKMNKTLAEMHRSLVQLRDTLIKEERPVLLDLYRAAVSAVETRQEQVSQVGRALGNKFVELGLKAKGADTAMLADQVDRLNEQSGRWFSVIGKKGDYQVIDLIDRRQEDTYFRMTLEKGFRVVSWVVNGVAQFRQSDDWKDLGTGIFSMAPFLNRLKEGKIVRNGRTINIKDIPGLAETLSMDGDTGNPMHGVARIAEVWKEFELGEDSEGVFIRASFETTDYPGLAEALGHSKMTKTFHFNGNDVTTDVVVENLTTPEEAQAQGGYEVIVDVGEHPFKIFTPGKTIVQVVRGQVNGVFEVDGQLIPTGRILPVTGGNKDLNSSQLLGPHIDNTFHVTPDANGEVGVALNDEGRGEKTTFVASGMFADSEVVHIWGGQAEGSKYYGVGAVEVVTATANGPQRQGGIGGTRVLKTPGERRAGRVKMTLESSAAGADAAMLGSTHTGREAIGQLKKMFDAVRRGAHVDGTDVQKIAQTAWEEQQGFEAAALLGEIYIIEARTMSAAEFDGVLDTRYKSQVPVVVAAAITAEKILALASPVERGDAAIERIQSYTQDRDILVGAVALRALGEVCAQMIVSGRNIPEGLFADARIDEIPLDVRRRAFLEGKAMVSLARRQAADGAMLTSIRTTIGHLNDGIQAVSEILKHWNDFFARKDLDGEKMKSFLDGLHRDINALYDRDVDPAYGSVSNMRGDIQRAPKSGFILAVQAGPAYEVIGKAGELAALIRQLQEKIKETNEEYRDLIAAQAGLNTKIENVSSAVDRNLRHLRDGLQIFKAFPVMGQPIDSAMLTRVEEFETTYLNMDVIKEKKNIAAILDHLKNALLELGLLSRLFPKEKERLQKAVKHLSGREAAAQAPLLRDTRVMAQLEKLSREVDLLRVMPQGDAAMLASGEEEEFVIKSAAMLESIYLDGLTEVYIGSDPRLEVVQEMIEERQKGNIKAGVVLPQSSMKFLVEGLTQRLEAEEGQKIGAFKVLQESLAAQERTMTVICMLAEAGFLSTKRQVLTKRTLALLRERSESPVSIERDRIKVEYDMTQEARGLLDLFTQDGFLKEADSAMLTSVTKVAAAGFVSALMASEAVANQVAGGTQQVSQMGDFHAWIIPVGLTTAVILGFLGDLLFGIPKANQQWIDEITSVNENPLPQIIDSGKAQRVREALSQLSIDFNVDAKVVSQYGYQKNLATALRMWIFPRSRLEYASEVGDGTRSAIEDRARKLLKKFEASPIESLGDTAMLGKTVDRYAVEKQLKDAYKQADVSKLPVVALGVHFPINGTGQKGIALWKDPDKVLGSRDTDFLDQWIHFSRILNRPVGRIGNEDERFWRVFAILQRMIEDLGDITIDYVSRHEEWGFDSFTGGSARVVTVMGVRFKKGSMNTDENLDELRTRIQNWMEANSVDLKSGEMAGLVWPTKQEIEARLRARARWTTPLGAALVLGGMLAGGLGVAWFAFTMGDVVEMLIKGSPESRQVEEVEKQGVEQSGVRYEIEDVNAVDGNTVDAVTDPAMLGTDVGGIDLNPELLDLKIKRDGNGIPLPMPQQSIQELMEIEGFLPVIINVTPIQSLPMLLGLEDDGTDNKEEEIAKLSFYRKMDVFDRMDRAL